MGLIAVRASTILMIGFAIVFGFLALFITHVWLNNQAGLRAKDVEWAKTVASQTVVVAKLR